MKSSSLLGAALGLSLASGGCECGSDADRYEYKRVGALDTDRTTTVVRALGDDAGNHAARATALVTESRSDLCVTLSRGDSMDRSELERLDRRIHDVEVSLEAKRVEQGREISGQLRLTPAHSALLVAHINTLSDLAMVLQTNRGYFQEGAAARHAVFEQNCPSQR